MYTVPLDGPEIDLCRRCQLVWFDAGELDSLPEKTSVQIQRDCWQEELCDIRRRRRDSDFYWRIIERNLRRAGSAF